MGFVLAHHSITPLLHSLPDRRLRLGFFHYRRANRLTFLDQFDLAVLRETSAGGNQPYLVWPPP